MINADLSMDPNADQKLWGGRMDGSTFKSVLYKNRDEGITRIGNQIYETPIKETVVPIDNREDIDADTNHKKEKVHHDLLNVFNPMQHQLFNYDRTEDRQIDSQKVNKEKQ